MDLAKVSKLFFENNFYGWILLSEMIKLPMHYPWLPMDHEKNHEFKSLRPFIFGSEETGCSHESLPVHGRV